MPLRLEIKRKLTSRSDRVKSVDIHPTEPWVLSSLWIGQLYIWNYNTQALVRSFEVTTLPVRAAKFIARKQWIVTGSDDNFVRVYNYNTLEKIKAFEAHTDYVRSIAVHPTLPYILTSSDDMLIKLWDWDKGWTNTQVFEGHNHFVMQVVFNPKDPNTFASASLDRTVKVWGLGSSTPHFTLEGHEKGVNCVEYFVGGEKPYLISGADDRLIKIWDYQNKTCVQTLEGHTHNVSVVCFHPNLPIIISGSEDHSVRIWHANTYRLEKTLNYGWDRVWVLAYLKGSNKIAIGYDEGTIMIKLGSEMPAVSMDQSGKIIWARHHEIQTVNVKTAGETQDGERLPLPTKDLGSCEIYPQTLKHNANGRFVVVCGDGEYIIYTALAWRNKSFGPGSEFVWATDAGEYAVKESSSKIKIFKNFKEVKALRPFFPVETMFGGALLGAAHTSYICFYDWDEGRLIRKIDVQPKNVYWSESGELVVISTLSTFYVLKYNKDVVSAAFESSEPNPDGIEGAFTVLHEIGERVKTATWVGDCFIFTNSNNRLNYSVGGNIVTIAHLDRNMYILGYIPRENRVFLIDKTLSVVSYTLHLSIISYQTAIIRGDTDTASKLLPKIPKDQLNRIAQFLERQNYKEEALHVTTDPDHKFELALQLQKLDIATDIAQSLDSEFKWKQLADITLSIGKFELAEKCLNEAQDLGGLLLLHLATGNREGVQKLGKVALEKGKNNIAFIAFFLLRQLHDCINLLVSTGRIPEAAFFARTYLPSEISRIVKLWREDLQSVNPKAADSLADPLEYGNLFDDLNWALKAESQFVKKSAVLPAIKYLSVKDSLDRDLIEEIQSLDARGLLNDEPKEVSTPTPTTTTAPSNSGSSSPSGAPSSPAPAVFRPVVESPQTPQVQAQSPVTSGKPADVKPSVERSSPFSSPAPTRSSPLTATPSTSISAPSPAPKAPLAASPVPVPAKAPAVVDDLEGDINFDELLDGEVEEILKGADVDLPDD